jgi:hypothetical protein
MRTIQICGSEPHLESTASGEPCRPEGEKWRTGAHVRSVTDRDGGLILDLKTGRFHSLNRTSAVVWQVLKQSPVGADSAEILEAMSLTFGAHPRMAADIHDLMQTFERKGFVEHNSTTTKRNPFARTVDVLHGQSHHVSSGAPVELPTVAGLANCKGRFLWTLAAWFGFLTVYVVLSIAGFPTLHRLLRWLSGRQPEGIYSAAKVAEICCGVNRAATYYVRKSWCLHRAAVTFALLRLSRIPAELIIGCQRVPFYSHAWVEIHGTVVNDNPAVKARYSELDRL